MTHGGLESGVRRHDPSQRSSKGLSQNWFQSWLELDDQGRDLAGPTEADTTVHGTASDVLLWLSNRHTDAVVEGDRGLLDAWTVLKR